MILQGDALHLPLRSRSVHCAITSPPFWGLRRYAAKGHLGLEKSPITYVYKLLRVFREVRRVLRDDGVLWMNLGDSYAAGGRGGGGGKQATSVGSLLGPKKAPQGLKPGDLVGFPFRVVSALQADGWWWRATVIVAKKNPMPESVSGWRWERHRVKVGPSARAHPAHAHAMAQPRKPQGASTPGGSFCSQADWTDCPGCAACTRNDGLILRRGSWRPTTAHEFVFMLTKSQRYWADGEAVREPWTDSNPHDLRRVGLDMGYLRKVDGTGYENTNSTNVCGDPAAGRNLRSVLSLATQPYAWAMCKACQEIYSPERFRRLHRDNGRRRCNCGGNEWLSHYAVFPEALVEPLIKASTSERGCCPTCGAGWARVIERYDQGWDGSRYGQNALKASGGAISGGTARSTLGSSKGKLTGQYDCLGWRPTCHCPRHAPVPPVVLDPFSGTGTVAVVAAKLGRKGIGLDLSWEYSRMAAARIAKAESWDPPAAPEAQMTLGI